MAPPREPERIWPEAAGYNAPMNGYLLLNAVRRRILWNSVTRATRHQRNGMILLTLLAIAFIVGDYFFFRRVIAYILTLPLELADIMIPQFLMVICLTFFSMLTFSNIIAAISTFYLSKDLDLLISSPVGMKAIFAQRFQQTTVNSSWMLFVFGLPIFVALGECSGAPLLYYPVMLLALAPFILIPAALGTAVTMLLMRWFPARKTYQFLSIIGLVFMGSLVMFFRFMQPEKFLGKKIPVAQIQAYVENLKVPSYPWLPSTWLTSALDAGTKGDFGGMWFWTLLSWAGAAALLAAVFFGVSRVYYRGWSIAYTGREGVRGRRASRVYPRLERLLLWVRPPLRTIIVKDMRIFWRDPAQWTQIFMLGALVAVYIFNIRSLPMDSLFLKNFVSVMNIGLAGVVLAAIAARFVFTSTSIEARSFWLIKCAPVDFSEYLWTKYFFYAAPLLLLAETLVVVSNLFLDVDPFLMAISAGGIFFITAGLTGLGIGLGALYPVFEHENIAEVGMSTGAIYYMILAFGYLGVTVMFGIRPVWVHFSEKFLGRNVGGWEVYACYAVVVGLTALVTVVPIRLGARSLAREEH